jgi:hypothetical protein
VRAESTGLSFVCRCSGDTMLNYGVGVLYDAVRCTGRGTVSVKRDGNMWASRTAGKGFARQARLATRRSPRLTRTERARASRRRGLTSRSSLRVREFRLLSTCRERNSDTHQLVGWSNWPGHPLSKPHGGPRPNSSRRSARDHLTGEVERFAPSGPPWAASWASQAAQLFKLKRHGDVC